MKHCSAIVSAFAICLVAFAGAGAAPAAPIPDDEIPSGAGATVRPPATGRTQDRPQSDLSAPRVLAAARQTKLLRGRNVRAASTPLPRLTSRFGWRIDPIRGGTRLHAGIDIPGPVGTPVRSSGSGLVRFAARAGGYGEMVEVDHGGGLQTRYAHLSRILVSPGMTVARGQVLGLMGSTGRSTGSHLHFEVREGGRPENPVAFLNGTGLNGDGLSGAVAFVPSQMVPGSIAFPAVHVSEFARRRAAAEARR